jgi:hypothetical protein
MSGRLGEESWCVERKVLVNWTCNEWRMLEKHLDYLKDKKWILWKIDGSKIWCKVFGWEESQETKEESKKRQERRKKERTKAGQSAPTEGEAEAEVIQNNPPKPPTPKNGSPTFAEKSFLQFWASYPGRRKKAKAKCLAKWKKLKPTPDFVNRVLSAIEIQKKSVDWTKDEGEYIPGPLVWLNGGCWDDEVKVLDEKETDSYAEQVRARMRERGEL